jgi:hypothetical protein
MSAPTAGGVKKKTVIEDAIARYYDMMEFLQKKRDAISAEELAFEAAEEGRSKAWTALWKTSLDVDDDDGIHLLLSFGGAPPAGMKEYAEEKKAERCIEVLKNCGYSI